MDYWKDVPGIDDINEEESLRQNVKKSIDFLKKSQAELEKIDLKGGARGGISKAIANMIKLRKQIDRFINIPHLMPYPK